MTDQEKLDAEIEQFGCLEDIPWGTLDNRQMTMGEMTDDHIDNCIVYHKGVRLIAESEAEDLNQDAIYLDSCRRHARTAKYIEFKMRKLKESRQVKRQNDK